MRTLLKTGPVLQNLRILMFGSRVFEFLESKVDEGVLSYYLALHLIALDLQTIAKPFSVSQRI